MFAVDAESGRGIALRIKIDDENALADGGERRAQVDRGGRLSHSALLVRHDKDARLGRVLSGLKRRGRVHRALDSSRILRIAASTLTTLGRTSSANARLRLSPLS